MVALSFGDTLTVRIAEAGKKDTLTCSNEEVPVNSDNLVLRAAAAYRARLKCTDCFEFHLEKQIPVGAGLGGGSGNAVAALSGMNQLLENPLEKETLYELAAELGSDCSFFVDALPAWMYGRGERIEPLDKALCEQLSGMPIVLFKPDFRVNTSWAYQCLAANAPENYHPDPVNKARLEASLKAGDLDALLCNSFETPVGKKYVALPTLLDQLRKAGVVCMMSGSGSSCFALPSYSDVTLEQIKAMVVNAWSKEVFWVETSIC